MAGAFISRHEKSTWGIPCNQNAQGKLFVGKGYGTPFDTQFATDITSGVKTCLSTHRNGRNGRFWVNLQKKTVTMAVGESSENKYVIKTYQ
jgi:hypothetical protein